MINYLRKAMEPSAFLLLLLLLSADLVFILLYITMGIFAPNPYLCDVSGICAYMNSYHLIKIFWVIVILVYILRATRCAGYASWTVMFTFFLIDDVLLLHQKFGDQLAGMVDSNVFPNLGLQPRYFELAILAGAGIILLLLVFWASSRSDAIFRKVSLDLFLFISALVFFGLIVDLAEWVKLGHVVAFGLQFVEDGGEQVVYSLIVWYVFLLAIRKEKMDLFLADLILHRKRVLINGTKTLNND